MVFIICLPRDQVRYLQPFRFTRDHSLATDDSLIRKAEDRND